MFRRNPMITTLAVCFALVALGLTGQIVAFAATSPSLGTAATYSILAGSEVTNTGATTISGNVGISPGTVAPNYSGFGTVTLGGVINDANAAALAAQGDKNTAYTALASQGCDTTYAGASKELAGLTLVPGVYCADRFFLSSGTLTLSGSSTDVWIFKSAADLVITGGASARVVFSGGGLACNVWWRVVSSATFDANSSLVGNILADTSITLASGASLDGRALARTAEVTLVGNTISGPSCTAAPTSSSSGTGTITVVKTVINDNGGTKTVGDFDLFISGTPVSSGVPNTLSGSTYTVYETADAGYTSAVTGDCDAAGHITLNATDNKVCIITNNDIGAPVVVPPVPPLIDVVKVPNPLSLPDGAGDVEYTYTLRNIGTVPVTDLTMVGDSCSPITLASGDTDSDDILDLTETWIYTCTATLTETHTNTVVATGWANGISATDIASATVVVGVPLVPPLIHVTKVPSSLALLVNGGTVTYTETITNPGTVPLSMVRLTDDKCSPMRYVSGDTNKDSKLDTTESWKYTCSTSLTETTFNTAMATGRANGFTVRDIATATVVVPTAVAPVVVPMLPNTGFVSENASLSILAGAFMLVSILFVVVLGKRRF